MSLGKELEGWLRGRATLVAMLDVDAAKQPRIHAVRLSQHAAPPPGKATVRAIIYHKISDQTESGLGDVVKWARAIMQFDCYGNSPDEADRLREMLKTHLDTLIIGGPVGSLRIEGMDHEGDRDLTEEPEDGSDKARFVYSCDYTVTYQRPTI